LLAEIVARNTGQSLPLHASRILEQLGIDNAVYAATPTDYAVPHALDGRTGKSRPIALSGIAEFWKSAHPGLRLCPADFMILVDTIMRSREGRDANTAETRRARALQQSRVQMPAVAYATIAEEPPISAGLGCREFRSGWFGSNGATSGHSFHVRYHGTHRFALVLGTNAHAPAVCERVTREIARSLGIEIEVPSSPESGTLPDTRELAGRYAGTSGPDIHVRVEGSELICEFAERAKVSMRIRIEPNGRGFTKIATGLWTLGFFMDARGDPCIVLNDISYRKAGSELPNDSR
jgi:hypothetical protein